MMDRSPDLFDWTPPPVYPEAPGFKERDGASREAAEAIAGKASTLRLRVLTLLQDGDEMTADEIAQALGETVLAVRPRVSELHRAVLIEKTGERRRNASGMSAAVWRAVRP